MGKRLKVVTVGCKANFADSASVVRLAAAEGFTVVPPASPADVVVINSCTVTNRADRDSRTLARKARRENPGSTVILAGCYAQAFPSERENVPEADYWAGTLLHDPQGIGEVSLEKILREVRGEDGAEPVDLSEYGADLLLGHRRTFLKIQDGCDFSCAYCVVPLARGKNRSVPEEEIARSAARAEEEGARELVLTGIHIGLYGADSGRKDALPALVETVLRNTSRARIRLSSVEPGEITDALIETVAENDRVCPHLHVPLQSGCDRTLMRMRRPYRSVQYLSVVSRAASRIRRLALGADVIAGFPGETRQEFEETVRFLENSPVTYLHAFPYSARPGTESAAMCDDVPSAGKKERVSRLRFLSDRMRDAFLARQVGATVDVLAEAKDRKNGFLSGRSGNYAQVVFPGHAPDIGEIIRVRVESACDGRLSGRQTG